MSELKAISGHEIREDIDYNTRGVDPEYKEWLKYGKELCDTLYYRKSEVDKVIEEKDTKIIQLEALIENYNRISIEIIDNANHHKYKRCLAMAKWCDEVMMSCELRGYAVHRMWANRHQWAMRYKYKWLTIAEIFKPE